MIVEERMYTMHPGKVPDFLKMYKEEGMPIQRPILGNLFGYFFNEVGTQNQVIHLWWYENFDEREKRRVQLAADERWHTYLAKVRPFVSFQETRIMKPAPFFEETIKKMLEAAKR